MLRHLSLEPGLQHIIGQPGQKPIRAYQLDAIVLATFDQLPSKLLESRQPCCRLSHISHCLSFRQPTNGSASQAKELRRIS